MKETIFALSSGRPPAAIAVVRISGPNAFATGTRLAGRLPDAGRAVLRDLRDPRSNELLDRALVLKFESPRSSTGEDVVEFQCHGGRAVVNAVLDALTSLDGLRPAEPGEFTRRAFENGRIDLTEAEGLADLLEAETQSQRRAALALAEGGLRKQIERWRHRLVALSAEVERAIDYDDAEETIDPALNGVCADLGDELRAWLQRPRIERLKDGVRVVVAGPPNAGKSSLVNAIAGDERAIVTDVPGTTRDHIEVPLALGGVPVLLTDTAGLRDSADRVEAIGIARTSSLIAAADVLLWLGDPNEAPAHPQLIRVHARCDLPERAKEPLGSMAVSSATGAGISRLLEEIKRVAQGLMPAEDAIALNRRQAALLEEAATALEQAARGTDLVLLAEDLRTARVRFDRLSGRAGVEELLDALFSRFCLGK